jgi:hypothetical protein
MHPVLANLINRFRADQDYGVSLVRDVLGSTLGVRLPTSNREWVAICAEYGLYHVRWVNGIEVYAHGYGIELIADGLTIDFDWGDNGEPDGFDAWRLWNHVRLNGLPLPDEGFSQVRAWLEEAAAAGELTQDTFLYYSPRQRARPGVESPVAAEGWIATLKPRAMARTTDRGVNTRTVVAGGRTDGGP